MNERLFFDPMYDRGREERYVEAVVAQARCRKEAGAKGAATRNAGRRLAIAMSEGAVGWVRAALAEGPTKKAIVIGFRAGIASGEETAVRYLYDREPLLLKNRRFDHLDATSTQPTRSESISHLEPFFEMMDNARGDSLAQWLLDTFAWPDTHVSLAWDVSMDRAGGAFNHEGPLFEAVQARSEKLVETARKRGPLSVAERELLSKVCGHRGHLALVEPEHRVAAKLSARRIIVFCRGLGAPFTAAQNTIERIAAGRLLMDKETPR